MKPEKPLRLVFAGTPEFAVPHLNACLRAGIEVVAVYTQPDRPSGRGQKLGSSPIKQAALNAHLTVEQPLNFKSLAARHRLAEFAPDLVVVVAYGLILSPKVLAIPRLGCWNMHASLLPRWRGAAPIQRSLLAGDVQTGACLMQMDAGLDTGPVLLRRELPIAAVDTGGSLHDKLAIVGAELLGEGLERLLTHAPLPATPQSHEGITYAHKLDKTQSRLDFAQTAITLECQVRAFDPWPIAEAQIGGETLRIWRASAIAPQAAECAGAFGSALHAHPGDVVAASRDGIDIACGDGILRIVELQRAGGRRISAADYVNANPALQQSARRAPGSRA